MSEGQVVFVSGNQGMIVVRHSDGFAVVELLGSEGEFGISDVVTGDWNALGSEPIYRDRRMYDAYFQGSWGSSAQAIMIARNTGGG
ncbi:hypothetical protein [Phenylobacterium sp.]|uniref:hypothetical protein n=1 Tax=Phenylobacterium sp. TaxID=1871053 RepID=UPI00286E66D0|nr:hypothetical protein [Phenylobacterium sp.]